LSLPDAHACVCVCVCTHAQVCSYQTKHKLYVSCGYKNETINWRLLKW
jgi:hypothetical protein